MPITTTKAERAAIILANEKIDAANAFYAYHKEIIDKFRRLQAEASAARSAVNKVRVNYINDLPRRGELA